MDIYERISEQQKGQEGTAVWMVGEQLKAQTYPPADDGIKLEL